MNTHSYPGRGLSLSQLIFALNEELKYVAHRSSFTLDAVSQLDNDISTALTIIREWRNSLVPINRVPLEVLSLIPTHLPYEDLLRVSSVCRHWRRTFIQHAALWSQLDLTVKTSDHFVKTLLERAKGSPLDIRSARLDRADILALLSPHSQQFRSLDFVKNRWSDVQRFSEAVSGPLPLLRTLGINVVAPDILGPEITIPPSSSLFSGAVSLKEFIFHSNGELFFNCFTFPGLTTFELSIVTEDGEFPASRLLDFLEATPTLETVHMGIKAGVDDPLDRVIVLPNVKVFSVTQDVPGYTIAAHISCPSARSTSLVLEEDVEEWDPQDAFPTSVSWNAIGPQYMARPIDGIVLAITSPGDVVLSCSISFLSPGPAILTLGYKMTAEDEGHIEGRLSLGEKHSGVFSRAFEAARKHPLLSSIKRLHIRDRHLSLTRHQSSDIASQAMQLLKSLGPLEELVLEVDDLQPFLSPFFAVQGSMQPDAFPSIKGLTIAERFEEPLSEECVDAIVGFAKSQHTRGIPFERVVLVMIYPPVGMAERLGQWVGTVHFCEAVIEDRDLV